MKKLKIIDIEKRYVFPSNLKIIEFKKKFLIISPNTATWIVLKNNNQLKFFELLRKKTIKEAISLFDDELSEAQKVLIQIEARNLTKLESDVQVFEDNETPRLHLYLTNSCNLCCPHCYMSSGKKKNDELSTEEIFNLLEVYSKIGKSIVFSGGEVTTRTDFYEIIEKAYNLGLEIRILSNGTLWTDELINKIAPLINEIQISIDGYNEETNAKVRGVGNFRKSMDCVDKFCKLNVKTEIGMTPLFDNELKNEYSKYVDFINEIQKKYDRKVKITFSGDILDGRDMEFSNEEKEEYKIIAEQVLTSCYGNFLDIPFVIFHKNNRIQKGCSYGNFVISSNGDVYVCALVELMSPIANIRRTNFKEIIELAKIAKKASFVDNILPCKNCELKYICGGDCRVKYFKKLAYLNFKELEDGVFPKRECTLEQKEKFYELMIKTNEQLFQ